jgi:hypothetical protein
VSGAPVSGTHLGPLDTSSAPIFGFNAAREAIVREVVERVVESAKDPLHYLNDAAYCEIKRLEPSKNKSGSRSGRSSPARSAG